MILRTLNLNLVKFGKNIADKKKHLTTEKD